MAKIAVEIPGYELDSLIGRGGMAEVYLARQMSLGRKVALKVLLQMLSADASFATRFEREAMTAAALQHPNIIKIFDTGMHDGRYYIAMEYLGSRTLRNLITEGMPPSLAVKFLVKLANALAYAHTKGVVHRDIKPTNILLYHDNEPVLSDFGISRMVDSNSTLTATGMMLGSPRYMSPEQARGATLDSRSDLYALGVVFYEMLTGAVPYDTQDTMALMYMHVNDAIPRLPAGLSRYQPVIDGLMAKRPEQRLTTAGEIIPLLGGEFGLTNQFSDTDETLVVVPERGGTSASQPPVVYTPGATAGSIQNEPNYRAASPSTGSGEDIPDVDVVQPAEAITGNRRPYGKYALLAVLLMVAAWLYWFQVPPMITSPPPVLDNSIEDIVKQLEAKVNAGEFEAARGLLEQGLSRDALDQRLLAMAERIRAGIKQQADIETVEKAGNEIEQVPVLAQEAAEQDKKSAVLEAGSNQPKDKAEIDLETEQKIADLKQKILDALVVNDLPEAKKILDRLKELGASVAEIDTHIANLEKSQMENSLPSTMQPAPMDAQTQILKLVPTADQPDKQIPIPDTAPVDRSATRAPVLNFVPVDQFGMRTQTQNVVPTEQPGSRTSALNLVPVEQPGSRAPALNLVPVEQPGSRATALNLVPLEQPGSRIPAQNIVPAEQPGMKQQSGGIRWNESEPW